MKTKTTIRFSFEGYEIEENVTKYEYDDKIKRILDTTYLKKSLEDELTNYLIGNVEIRNVSVDVEILEE